MKHQSSQPAWAAYAHTPLNIFYAAQQLPQGRTLSALQFTDKGTTWLNEKAVWSVWAVKFA